MSRDNRSQTRERTEEERERAREERKRRRMAKGGTTQQPAPPPLPPPLAELPHAELPHAELPHAELPHAELPHAELPLVELPPAAMGPPEDPVDGDPHALAPEPHQFAAPENAPPPYPQPLPAIAPSGARRASSPLETHPSKLPKKRGAKPATARASRHRPHLHRPHISPLRRGAARATALLALVIVLLALAGGAVLLVRHSEQTKTPSIPAIVKVVIPEGYTRTQIASLAHADGLRGSYLAASKSSLGLRLSRYRAPTGTPSLEGFLFPATYEIYAGAPVSRLVSEQLVAFRQNFGGAEIHRAKVLAITPYELLIVASIIEREAAIARDRPLVAAVIYNRLHQNMSLGVDSTLRYALHDFTHPLTEAELASGSPYNTRTHKGLPPTPISNPGVAALAAAAHPANVSYFYYVSGADGCGEQVFSTSYAQFEKNAAAYREALRKNGGRVPTCKKK